MFYLVTCEQYYACAEPHMIGGFSTLEEAKVCIREYAVPDDCHVYECSPERCEDIFHYEHFGLQHGWRERGVLIPDQVMKPIRKPHVRTDGPRYTQAAKELQEEGRSWWIGL